MKIKQRINKRISPIMDISIPPGKFGDYVGMLDRENRFNRKNLMLIIIELYNAIEVIENIIEDETT